MSGKPLNHGAWAASLALVGFALLMLTSSADAQGSVDFGPFILSVEDSFPSRGDQDHNDVVIQYRYTLHLDASGNLEEFLLEFQPLAYGSIREHGFAVHLLIGAANPSSASIERPGDPAPTVLAPVEGESELAWILLDSVRNAFCTTCLEVPINTVQGEPPLVSSQFVFSVVFDPPIVWNQQGSFPFDPFVYRTGNYPHQIHLPVYRGSDLMNQTLFDTQDDCSDRSDCVDENGLVTDNSGRFFVDARSVPWVLESVEQARWPKEGVSFEQAQNDPTLFYELTFSSELPALQVGAALILLGALLGLGVKATKG